jgi:hypothetical protein
MITFMQQQADTNREFLRAQREQTNLAIARLAEEQKTINSNLAKLTNIIDHISAEIKGVRKRNRNV